MRPICTLGIAASAILLSTAAMGQAPPTKTEQLDPNACAQADTPSTVGKGGEVDQQTQDAQGNLSDKLARSGGVICPPKNVDREIRQPTPPGGAMPVIPPPGTPGGDQSIQPK